MTETTAHDRPRSTAPAADDHAAAHSPPPLYGETVQTHPLRVYLLIWFWLFVLSAASYAVDVSGLEGVLKWSLITFFMLTKAGLIVAIFMHMAWERLALVYAIVAPPLVLLVFVAIMALESDYTLFTRITHFD
jgi:cytochrome c oxidase subunit IV